ncbi:VWA domain-containing protein [Nocardioides sp. NPDC058538]|uniref:VWA domain-containing protein n=1 Tax=Nocardioides sp. NPDC058538 TaxID=3346542 RepID=UPI00364DF7A2
MRLTQPLFLLALVPVALLAIGYLVMQRRRIKYALRFATAPMLERLVPHRPRWRRHLAAGLVVGALAMLAVATTQPQVRAQVPYERATILVAIDTSASMSAEDMPPNRLEAAKSAAVEFIDQLPPRYNVGLVSFSSSARVVSSPTTDHALVARSIEGLGPPDGGTAIGETVFSSVNALRQVLDEAASAGPSASPSPSPDGSEDDTDESGSPAHLVLLSDGGNSAGRNPVAAAEAASEAGLPVSTIAYGTEGPSAALPGGQSVEVREDTLRELADTTGGEFYRASSADELREVYDDIGTLVGYHVEYREITVWIVIGAMVLAFVAAALSLRWFARLI